MGLLFSTSGAYAVENGFFIIQQKAVVLPDVFRECLQLAAIQVEQPPAALAHHVGVQVAVVVVADILVAGGRTLRRMAQRASAVTGPARFCMVCRIKAPWRV